MTSSYTDTITKLKNALENVFIKKTDVKNNLTSTDTDKPLSANQGKALNDNKVDKISGKGLSKNDFTDTYKTKLDNLDTNLANKANSSHTHGNLQDDGKVGTSNNTSKNVVTDGNGRITTEDKPTIPSPSSSTPSADITSGYEGTSTYYSRADHQHPLSSYYATANHNQASSTIIESSSFAQLGTSANATQHDINSAINNLIGSASGDTNSIVDYYYDSTTNEIVFEYNNGKLITSISKSTSGNTDTYTINFNDNTTYSFDVTNGSSSSVDIVTNTNGWNSTTSDSKVPSEKLVKNSLDDKLDKIHTSYKGKNVVTNASTGAIEFENKPTIPTKVSDLNNDSNFISTSNTVGLIKNDGTIDTNSYLTTGTASSTYVAKESGKGLFSGSYTDLTNKPSIPSASTDLSDTATLIRKSNTSGFVKNDGSIDDETYMSTAYIVDNLTSTNAGKVLSAKQGKVLNDLIGTAISYINQ